MTESDNCILSIVGKQPFGKEGKRLVIKIIIVLTEYEAWLFSDYVIREDDFFLIIVNFILQS